MYEKPTLSLVGEARAIVLGPIIQPGDNEGKDLMGVEGLVAGLDD